MDVGSALGAIGRAAVGAGRLMWAVMTAPTTGTESDAHSRLDDLARKIEDEVPEELRARAWGVVLDALDRAPDEIDQLREEHRASVAEESEDPATNRGTAFGS
ncbi:hypothetical protein [Streptomyces sp. NPDC088864]|uniref:hypothetical protein n=1 Tax=Streptomyces sp. NPDC088864 TaxID=3365910 RepID=UPI0037FAAF9F